MVVPVKKNTLYVVKIKEKSGFGSIPSHLDLVLNPPFDSAIKNLAYYNKDYVDLGKIFQLSFTQSLACVRQKKNKATDEICCTCTWQGNFSD